MAVKEKNTAALSDGARKVATNAGYLMSSQLITWVLTLGLTILLPRFLGPEGVGQLHLANSLWAIAAVFVGFGINTLIIKEVARDPEQGPRLFGQTVITRLFLFVIAAVGLGIYVSVAGYQTETVLVIAIIGVATLARTVSQTARAGLTGLERMRSISIADISDKLLVLIIAVPLLLLGYGVVPIAAVGVIAAVAVTIILFVSLRSSHSLRLHFDLRDAFDKLRASFSYLATEGSLVVYRQVDVIIISLLVNETTVGWYSAADRLAGTMYFIPAVFITAVFPLMSRLHEQSPEKLRDLAQRSFNMMLVVSVPIGLGMFVVANNVTVLIFGPEFAESGPVLATMGIVVLLTYQNTLLGRLAIAMDRQKLWAIVMVVATLLTIPIDLTLIPWTVTRFGNGALGGAMAYVITEGIMLVAGLYILSKQFLEKDTVLRAGKVLLAGGIMVAATWPLRDMFVALPILAGAAVYVFAILGLRAIPAQDLALLKRGALRIARRIPGISNRFTNQPTE